MLVHTLRIAHVIFCMQQQLWHVQEQYADETFVHVLPAGQIPHTRHVRGSNFTYIGVFPDRLPGRAIIISGTRQYDQLLQPSFLPECAAIMAEIRSAQTVFVNNNCIVTRWVTCKHMLRCISASLLGTALG